MNRSIRRLGAATIAALVSIGSAAEPATAACELDSGVRLVNGTTGAITVNFSDACSHAVPVDVPAGHHVLVPASSGVAHIMWGSSGENSPDPMRGQVDVQRL